jgi:hypothetical protein
MDRNGNILRTIVNKDGKSGTWDGMYWSFGAWKTVQVDVSNYRGLALRLYFQMRHDGYGDQTRVFVDDAKVE